MTLKETDIKIEVPIPVLNGLVLAGGRSRRMGRPKDQIAWHGQQQRYHAADLLKPFCKEVYISCRADQVDGIDPEKGYQPLPDTFLDMGPLSGILSAFRSDNQKGYSPAWLVVACDLPLLTSSALAFLVSNRNPMQLATAFNSPHDGLPEPLITIWEPASFAVLLAALSQGITCPRKTLINSGVTLLRPLETAALTNVNTPEEAKKAQLLLNQL